MLEVQLVPSLETIAAYDAEAGRWRLSGWIVGGFGVAALGAGLALWAVNDVSVQGFNRDLVSQHCEEGALDPPDTDSGDCSEFTRRRGTLDALSITSRVLAGTGVAAAGVALFLLLAGPETGIYDAYKPSVTAGILPLGGGAAVSVGGGF